MSTAGRAIRRMSGQTTRASVTWLSTWLPTATWRCRSTSMQRIPSAFGEPTPGERLKQIVDKHLKALATSTAGGENKFGVDLKGKADMQRLALIGHSRGGEKAVMLTHSPEMAAAAKSNGYGPVAGILQVAPSPVFVDPADGSAVPLGIILPMCDADVINQEGQHFYEGAETRARPADVGHIGLRRAREP